MRPACVLYLEDMVMSAIKSSFCPLALVACALVLISTAGLAGDRSLDIPSAGWGISIGNRAFTGLRRIIATAVSTMSTASITLAALATRKPASAVLPGARPSILYRIRFLSQISWFLGVGAGDDVKGITLGGLGVGAGGRLSGLQIGGLGVGSGDGLYGITLAGLGGGSGGNVAGFSFAGLGFGAGGDLRGVTLAGFGAGAGDDLAGIQAAGFGVGAGGKLTGLSLAGFGVGAGGDITGVSVAGFGVGTGGSIRGITVGGLAVGAGQEICGITLAGIAAGSPTLRGLTIAGLAIVGKELKGVQLAVGTVGITEEGRMSLFSASAFNYFKGTQSGLSIGLVNFAWRLRGLQLGIINIVKENPRYLRVLPFFNAGF